MNFKQFVRDYFTFSRNERKGITILFVLIFLLAIANKIVFMFETPAKIDTVLLDSVSSKLGQVNDSIGKIHEGTKLFTFDPNVIDSVALDSLDLPLTVKRNIVKFRIKGGRFFSASDFRKIYGVTDLVFARVSPFLKFNQVRTQPITDSAKPEFFIFDPNTTTDAEFLRLGLTVKQITTIRNYRNKGGTFRKKEDFLKIYGLTAEQKRALQDYVEINKNEEIDSKEREFKAPLIELNSADSVQLKQLPGIGEKLSKRIVKYRDLLGGFYAVSQLKEVYGLSEETFRKIEDKVRIDTTKIQKLKLNFDDAVELGRHPYLKKNLAKKIVNFRTKNGSIHDLSVLRDSMILNIDEYIRLKPYL